MLLCVWRKGTKCFFMETSAQLSSRWAKEVDQKVTVRARRGSVIFLKCSSRSLVGHSDQESHDTDTQPLSMLLSAYFGVLQAHMKKRLNEMCTDVKVFASRPLRFYYIVWNCHCKNYGHLFSAVTAFIRVFIMVFSPKCADSFSQWCTRLVWGNSRAVQRSTVPGVAHWETPTTPGCYCVLLTEVKNPSSLYYLQ